MKDQKGYAHRPMDRQDLVVLIGCVLTILALAVIFIYE